MRPNNTSPSSNHQKVPGPARSNGPDQRGVVQTWAKPTLSLRDELIRSKWRIRIHWGIAFAVISSLILWSLIFALAHLAP